MRTTTNKIYFNNKLNRHYILLDDIAKYPDDSDNYFSVRWLSKSRDLGYHRDFPSTIDLGWLISKRAGMEAYGFTYAWEDTIHYTDADSYGFQQDGTPIANSIKALGLLKSLLK